MKPFFPFHSRLVGLFSPLLLAAGFSVAAVVHTPGTVSTVAGFGIVDRANVDINLVSPGLMTVDDTGYVYFSDSGNNVVYGRDPWGTLDIYAGNGIPGFTGDGGPSLNSLLNHPTGVATTPKSGNPRARARM